MNTRPDEKAQLNRARLCELAEVERGKHGRWQDRRLLARRKLYGLLDVLGAAQLDELSRRLGPKASATVWGQVRGELGVAGKRLEVVVSLATLSASLVRSGAELDAGLPRGEKVVVVDLSERSARVLSRYRAFEATEPVEASPSATASTSASTSRRLA